MRVELYGCGYEDGVVRYAAPAGQEFSPHVFLEDVYDGDVEKGNGLGVLVDGLGGDEVVFSKHGIDRGEWETEKDDV